MSLKKLLMLSTVAAGAVASLSTGASAQNVQTVYGNGASLPAPYFRQAANCYSEDTPLIFTGNPPTTQDVPDFNYTGPNPQNCRTNDYRADERLVYLSTGSGTGIIAFYSHAPARAGDTDPAAGNQFFPEINYAVSETSLSQADIDIYDNGGVIPGSSSNPSVVAPSGTPAEGGPYANPRYNYGAAVQFPLLIAPVTVAYDSVYKKVRKTDGTIQQYTFQVQNERPDKSGGLRLSQEVLCRIFNGQITNWNDPTFAALQGGVDALKFPTDANFNVPMQIVGREDSSGTTSLWTRFLANACQSFGFNQYPESNSRLPGTYRDSGGSTRTQPTVTSGADLVGAVWNKNSANWGAGAAFYFAADNGPETLGKYTLANGNDGVAKYIDFTRNPGATPGQRVIQGRIGYVGPDYVRPAADFTRVNNYRLSTFSIENAAGQYRDPVAEATRAAFGSILAPESDANGNYAANTDCVSTNEATRRAARCRNQPEDWVEPALKSSPLANPTGAAAYPIVGTSNMLMYTCYADQADADVLRSFVNYYNASNTIQNPNQGLLAKAGFQGLPTGWRNAIRNTFVVATAPAAVLNLDLQVSSVGNSDQCPATGPNGTPIGG